MDPLYDDFDDFGSEATAFGPGVFDDGFDEITSGQAVLDPEEINPMKVKSETLRIAQANREAASPEQHALAMKLRSTPIQDFHAHKSNKNNCIDCAKKLNDLYLQSGSNIDFAMVDSRWPKYICKHLKPDVRCSNCYGISLCMHNKERFRCTICGNSICHDPTHEIYRKIKPLRKSNCPGCKEKNIQKKGVSKGGSTKKKQSKKRKQPHSTKRKQRKQLMKKGYSKKNIF